MTILIKNSKIINKDNILRDHCVLISEGKIKEILKEDEIKEEVSNIIDAEGKYLSPGFIDIHNHGNFGHDAMEGTIEAIKSMAKYHVKNGVTSFLATTMTGSNEETKNAITNVAKFIKNDNNKYSRVLGLYLEGPYFSQDKKGAQPSKYLKNPDINEIKEFIKLSNNNIKVMALAPELSNALEAIKYLKSNNINVSLGHTNATYEEATKAIELGATGATHLYNGMRVFSHREPGVIGAVLCDERVMCEMICDGIHIHKAAMQMAVKIKGVNSIILISDAMMAAGLDDGEYLLGGQKVFVKNNEARLVDGTLAGSTLKLNNAVKNMIDIVGVSLQEAVKMATLNPAKAIGVTDKKGSIEVGKDADLIIFDNDINVAKVIINGVIIR